jgi:hypothetical protein
MQNLADVNFYPNPTEGKFSLSFYAANRLRQVTLTIRTVTGRLVHQEQCNNITGRFTKEIDVSAMPKGVYFAEIRADGEKVTKKVVVE